jgi:hypothetical protein
MDIDRSDLMGLERSLPSTVITTFRSDFAVASTLFHRARASGKLGRQMQTSVRLDGLWQDRRRLCEHDR